MLRTLFVISTVALMALLWASVSIARHIRRARRRRRAQAERAAPEAAAPPTSPAQNIERPDWAHFNKDLGDLRDPYEERRSKPRGPSRL